MGRMGHAYSEVVSDELFVTTNVSILSLPIFAYAHLFFSPDRWFQVGRSVVEESPILDVWSATRK